MLFHKSYFNSFSVIVILLLLILTHNCIVILRVSLLLLIYAFTVSRNTNSPIALQLSCDSNPFTPKKCNFAHFSALHTQTPSVPGCPLVTNF